METQKPSPIDRGTIAGTDASHRHDATALGRRLRSGELTPERALADASATAHRLNKTLNCITRYVDPDADAFTAADTGSPFWGVPFLLKDAFAALKGAPTSNGTKFLETKIATEDSVLVSRLKQAGLQIFGQTTCPAFNSLATTEGGDFGSVPNPWDISRSAGGSSGGSAAAVSAGIVTAAHGSDGAGSIRIPAAYCGLVGMKPSRGRVTLQPLMGETINGGMSEGVLTRTVRDSAALLDIIAGPAPGDSCIAPRPKRTFLSATNAPFRTLGIAIATQPFAGGHVDDDCMSVVDKTVRQCVNLGHHCSVAVPGMDPAAYRDAYAKIWPVSVGRSIRRVEGIVGAPLQGRLDPFNQHLYQLAEKTSGIDLTLAIEAMQHVSRWLYYWMDRHDVDVLISPTVPTVAPKLGHFDAAQHGGEAVYARFLDQTSFTTIANMTGAPAISLPRGLSVEGLPIGIQLLGRYGREDILFALSAQLETAGPWHAACPGRLRTGGTRAVSTSIQKRTTVT